MFNRYKLSKEQLKQIQEVNRLATFERFKAIKIRENTMQIDHGQKLAKQQEQIADVMERVASETTSQLLNKIGIPPNSETQVDLSTGVVKIVKTHNESPISQTA